MNVFPTVSVILPNYNHSVYLKERIESILNQTYQDFELILLDDCSTDGSRAVLSAYKNHPKVASLTCNEVNGGNTFLQWDKGIRLAKGKYIWIAESDDAADVSFLENVVPALEQNPGAAICLTGSFLIDGQSRIMQRKSRDRWKETGEVKAFDGKEYVRHNLLYRNYVYNASMVVFRRDVYERLDKCFQRLRCAGDWLFWIEMAQEGKVVEVRKKLNYFRLHSNKVTSRSRYTGEGMFDTIDVMSYLFAHAGVGCYKRCLVRGECYRLIGKLPVSADIRAKLYAKAKKNIGVLPVHFYMERLNRILAFVLPFLPTHKRDKMK